MSNIWIVKPPSVIQRICYFLIILTHFIRDTPKKPKSSYQINLIKFYEMSKKLTDLQKKNYSHLNENILHQMK